MHNYKVYYKNDNCPEEKWEYIIPANGLREAKWNGILKAESEGHLAGWLDVFCEEQENGK